MSARTLALITGGTGKTPRTLPPRRRATGTLLLLPAAPLLLALGYVAWWALPGGKAHHPDLVTYKVHRDRLQRTATERGTLESAVNSDVICQLKARVRGSTIASTIKWVIDEGAPVKRGDVVMLLDSSGLEEDLKTQNINVLKARSDWVAADANLAMVERQNHDDIETAKINLRLAELDLQKYLKGDYLQARHDLDGRLATSESDLAMWRDRVAWSSRMVKKGYLTPNQEKGEQSRFETSQLGMQNLQEELRVLEGYTRRRVETELRQKLSEAHLARGRVEDQARAKLIQAQIDVASKKKIYDLESKRYREIEDEIKKCVLSAPQDGIVVYYVSEQARSGSGSQQGLIAQGEPVREGQKLMQIPDLSNMVVETMVHEALLAHVQGEEREPSGFGRAVKAALLTSPDRWSALVACRSFEELRDRFRQADERLVFKGDDALIQVQALPNTVLHGHVKHVSAVPSQREWMMADIKVYATTVAIDEPITGLKPGMSTEVTILCDDAIDNVLTVPVEAVIGAVRPGETSTCVVVTSDGPVARPVVVGASNEAMVEIKSGLQEGEEVVLNPAAVPGEVLGETSR